MTDGAYRIVCAVDGSAGADRAVDLVGALPMRTHDEVVVASRPTTLFAGPAGDDGLIARTVAAARERAHVDVDAGVARLATAGIHARGAVCEGDDTVDALTRLAVREQAALIVVGSRGRGAWTSILLGSTARALAITSPVATLIVRDRPVAPRRIVAGVDGSPSSRAALIAFAGMPQSDGAVVELLHVLPMHEWPEDRPDEPGTRADVERDEDARGTDMLERERRLLPPGLIVRTRQERGHVGETILRRAADTDADLIVIGTRGLGGPRQPFFGSTAERVLTHARANVLVGPHADAGM